MTVIGMGDATEILMPVVIRMNNRLQTTKQEGYHKRVTIGFVSWTAIRVPSYYGRYASARRDSARRPAEGRER